MNRRFNTIVVSASTAVVGLLLIGALLGQAPQTSPAGDPYRHIGVFTEVFSKIKSDYVEEPDMKGVTLGAINGMLVSVDPFASYLNADQYKQYLKARESAQGGVGLVLSRKYGYEIGVVDAIPGSPADKAGLATGDILESINGIGTRDMPLAYTEVLLNGEPGTTVKLTVLRLRRQEPVEMTLTRAKVAYPALAVKMLEDKVGYIQVRSLEAGKVKAIAEAVKDLEKQGMQKLALDLRHAAVGTPEDGIELARLFLEKGAVASLAGQRVTAQKFEAEPAKVLWKGPMVVLTNRGTTSGTEVAAAALLDNKRAAVVGERTYGDAAVRKTVATEDGGAVLLAVGKYLAPSGKAIMDSSVIPSVAVIDPETFPDEDEDKPQGAAKPQEDMVLKRALEVLQKGLPAESAKAAPKGEASAPLGPPGVPRKQ